ncbi:hypothetical protein QFZ96_002524 [Paraburkholderia youngii]
MPSAIPYDPALALGNLVSIERLHLLEQVAGCLCACRCRRRHSQFPNFRQALS